LSPVLRDYGLSREALAQTAGVLNYGMAGPFESLDVTTTTFSRVGRIGLHMVDPLVWQVRSGQFAPGLATSWTISPDATSYTFKLREDVKFHDGTPFDAEAVKITYDRIVDPQTRAQSALSLIGPYAGSDEYQLMVEGFGAAVLESRQFRTIRKTPWEITPSSKRCARRPVPARRWHRGSDSLWP